LRIYHGTACAGQIGAVVNNERGIAGLNWSVQLMSLRFVATNFGTFARAIECLEYAANMKRRGINIRVINHS